MLLHRPGRDLQQVGDRPVGQTLLDERAHLPLAFRQVGPVGTRWRCPDPRLRCSRPVLAMRRVRRAPERTADRGVDDAERTGGSQGSNRAARPRCRRRSARPPRGHTREGGGAGGRVVRRTHSAHDHMGAEAHDGLTAVVARRLADHRERRLGPREQPCDAGTDHRARVHDEHPDPVAVELGGDRYGKRALMLVPHPSIESIVRDPPIPWVRSRIRRIPSPFPVGLGGSREALTRRPARAV